jgi:hypothetical protein
VNYNPPAGRIGGALAQLLGADPGHLIKEDLRRLKQMMETGEIATIDGQTSGRASGESAMGITAPAQTDRRSETTTEAAADEEIK